MEQPRSIAGGRPVDRLKIFSLFGKTTEPIKRKRKVVKKAKEEPKRKVAKKRTVKKVKKITKKKTHRKRK